jgi:iron complex transport system ATP-binding protein
MQTRDLTLKAGPRTLITGLDWQLENGQCWCLIGRNGAGKSTLLRTLAGLRDAEGGTVELAGRALTQWTPEALARQRAYLSQARSDAFGYRVIDTILSARHPYHGTAYWESATDHAAALAALQAMDVAALAQRDVRTLSGGERQRVAIAAVLAQDTPLLLLDEPASALDLAHQMSVMALMQRLCRVDGRIVVMVSHDLNMAQIAATHALLMMADGSWHAGPVAEVLQADLLSRCLGYPIEAVPHGARTLFLPVQDAVTT